MIRIKINKLILICFFTISVSNIIYAQSETLSQALLEYENANYDKCKDLFIRQLRSGQNTKENVALIYFYLGKIYAAEDDMNVSQNYFEKALSLNPSFTIPQNSSPKITEPFIQAKTKATSPLSIEAVFEARLRQKKTAQIEVITYGNNLKLIKSVNVLYKSGAKKIENTILPLEGQEKIDIELPVLLSVKQKRIEFYIVGVDEYGNELTNYGSKNSFYTIEYIPSQQEIDAFNKTKIESHWYTKWWLWTIVGGIVVAGVVSSTLLAIQSESTIDFNNIEIK